MNKDKIPFSEFLEIENKLEIRVGIVSEAEKLDIPKKNNVLKLEVSFGDDDLRTVITTIGDKFSPQDLMGLKIPFITNLEPAKMYGHTSSAMIMLVDTIVDGEKVQSIEDMPNHDVGSKIF